MDLAAQRLRDASAAPLDKKPVVHGSSMFRPWFILAPNLGAMG